MGELQDLRQENEKLRLTIETVRQVAEGWAKSDADDAGVWFNVVRLLKDVEAGSFPAVAREL